MKMDQMRGGGMGGVVLVVVLVTAVFGLAVAPAVGWAQTVPTRTPTPGPATATPTPDEPPPTETPVPTATSVPPTDTPPPTATSTQVPTTAPTATGTPTLPVTPAVTLTAVPTAVTLTLSANTTMVVPGQVVTFTATLTNTATAALADLTVVLEMPPELTAMSSEVAEGQTVTERTNWQIPVLASGGSATWELVAEMSDSVPPGTVLDVRAGVLDQQAVVSLGLPPAFLPRVGESILDFGLILD